MLHFRTLLDLTEIPSSVYGIKYDADFSPVRDISFCHAQGSALTLQWILVAAEAHLSERTHYAPATSVLARKVRAYKMINQHLASLNDGAGTVLALLGGITMAIIAESRTGNFQSSGMHFRGYQQLLHLSEWQERLMSCPGTTDIILHSSNLVPYLFEPSALLPGEEFDRCALSILESLPFIREWLDCYRFEPSHKYAEVLECLQVWSSQWSSDHPNTRDAAVAQMRINQPYPLLDSFLRTGCWDYAAYVHQSNHFLSLSNLVAYLFTYKLNSNKRKNYLDVLSRMIERSISPKKSQAGMLSLTLEGFQWLVLKCRYNAICWDARQESVEHDQRRLLSTSIEMLRFFGSLGVEPRMNLIRVLCMHGREIIET